ncbi:MAG: hypothetical protein RMJ37_07970 [Spirochaetia bacterium]|nr:hypothetical protein [Spirochaetota bacterium]MDW8113250.1 hypothetical protein [Spirochaetia bacterium]
MLKSISFLNILLLAVFVSGCIYKETVYINRPREFSERILGSVYTNLNFLQNISMTTNTNLIERNIFSYSILDSISRIPYTNVKASRSIVAVEISSTVPEYIHLVRRAILQEIYLQEGGTIPLSSISEKSPVAFLAYSLLFPGLSLLYAVGDNALWDLDFEAVRFDEAHGVVVNPPPIITRDLGILSYGILSELTDKFLLLYAISAPWTVKFEIYLLIGLIIRVSSAIIGLDLINKHNTIINSGYNVDRNFSVSLLYNKDNYPLVEVRMFQVRF